MCGGIQGITRGDQFSAAILMEMQENIDFENINFPVRNIYLRGVKIKNEFSIVNIINIAGKYRRILNIVEPNRDLTYLLVKNNFSVYIEGDIIVWAYW